ncbi:mitochondrial import receptor subunit TOM7 homolog [Mugil cephalus]|uniref:mitochondrial import receptor subunit TOM7 homolog n=1 Tax=Mugil cephalus TaxID=48193 RepID=UPI001FB743EB|nr:mitochondrial import receptor subunit TOM7 homolog [Mugil cephalus]
MTNEERRCSSVDVTSSSVPLEAAGASLCPGIKHMAKLSKETKQRLQQLFQCGQFVIRWGFIPTVLYLGFKRGADPGMPEPTVLSLLWG